MHAGGRRGSSSAPRAAVTALLALGLLVPAGPARAAPAVVASAELDTVRDRLGDATRELEAVEAELRRVAEEVAELDTRLIATTTRLARVTEALTAAEAASVEADRDERRAAAHLAAVQQRLGTALDDWDTHRRRLADRLVQAYKHGGAAAEQFAVRGVLGADDWHRVAVTLETVERLTADEDGLVDEAVASTRATAAARTEAGDARRRSVETAAVAAEHRRRVVELVADEERLLADVANEQHERTQLLASLEADAATRAVLVRDLERRVAELEFAAVEVFVPVEVDLDVQGPPPVWAERLPSAGRPYATAVEATAARYGLDGRILAALVWTESGFRADAVSHAGALGLTQLMPGTAAGLGVDPRDPLQNLDGGARYLRAQLDRFGRIDLALAAYNAGPGRVERAGGIPEIVETQLYVVRVLERFEELTR